MIVSGYQLDMYCDNIDDDSKHMHGMYDPVEWVAFPRSFCVDGRKCYSQARKMAKQAGWVFKRDGRVFCPRCSPKKTKPTL